MKPLRSLLLLLPATLALLPLRADDASLRLRLRSRIEEKGTTRAVEKTVEWAPARTALVICDMWDRHWCKSAEARVGELTKPIDALARLARARGMLVLHAPSTCTDFYKDTPQRKRARAAPFARTPVPLVTTERWGTAWCWPDGKREAPLPIDDSDMGCDCVVKCEIRSPWTRQAAGIEIGAGDVITDNGQETWNLLAQKKIDNVLICGVHLNMCVLGRPFAIRQMVRLGKNVALVRDLTDTMYNPERPPGVSHFAGTDLMVAHVERFWCPSVASTDLTGRVGDPPFRFAADRRK